MYSKIKNIGIMAHVDAGKTTLTERILHISRAIARPGSVDSGDTVTDSMAVERMRGITVRAGTASFYWKDAKVNIIDTPGHMDFICEVERVFAVLDGAVLVISAREGVQMQTKVIFGMLSRLRVPTLLFVNKLDRLGADLCAVYGQIADMLTPDMIPIQRAEIMPGGKYAIGGVSLEPCAEAVAERDEEALGAYLDGGAREDLLRAALIKEVRACAAYPLMHGVALRGDGVECLMDAIVGLLPDAGGSPDADLTGYVYKIDRGDNNIPRAYIRVFDGVLRARQSAAVADDGDRAIKARTLLCPDNGAIRPSAYVPAGDIAVLENEKGLRVGDVIGARKGVMPEADCAKAFLQVSVEPVIDAELPRLAAALRDLEQEDPMLGLSVSPEMREITLRVLGRTQLEVLEALLLGRYGLAARFGRLATVYKETPLSPVRAFIPMGGANPFRGGIEFEIYPLGEGDGVQYECAVSAGDLTIGFRRAVEEGARAGCERGPYGWEVTDLLIKFTNMQFDSVSGTPAAYRQLGPFVIDRALRFCGTRLLEPVCAFRADVPARLAGRVAYDIERMRGRVDEVVSRGNTTVLTGTVPAQTIGDYGRELHGMTEGRGQFVPEPAGYARYDGEIERSGKRPSLDWERQQHIFMRQEAENPGLVAGR